ncbi:MAG: methylmalonyl Co-A mutase-associated GTPase MeaB [Deltaproteobacteria bacterium]|nr:methylmalonyl Co-A mutase-associated GTPase MeaB [Deltaproteobacteria bacterium]
MEVSGGMVSLIDKLKQGDTAALARLITLLEEGELDMASIEHIVGKTGVSFKIGFTGPPGAGKSSLIDWIMKHIRAAGGTVGVLATDPSSPFTGGAILGDRIRMQHHFLDDRVFIRSLGSRGASGGISRIARDASYLMQAAGYGFIILETVGVGQTELDIMDIADTVAVVLVPESGDFVQAMKAGLMEAADIFVVNKADREGSRQMVSAIKFLIETSPPGHDSWQVPVMPTNGLDGTGTAELFGTVLAHREFLGSHGNADLMLRKRLHELKQIVIEHLGMRVDGMISEALMSGYSEELADPSVSVYSILNRLMHDERLLGMLLKRG